MSHVLSGFISPMQEGGDGYTHATLCVKVTGMVATDVFIPPMRLYTAHCGRQSVSAIPVTTFAGSVNAAICRACVQAIEAEQRRKCSPLSEQTVSFTAKGGNKP